MAAIAKLNKNIKNKGEEGYEESPINKKLLQDICDKADEIIDNLPLKKIIESGDFDNALETGFYVMKGFPKNAPNSHEHFHLIVNAYTNPNYILQIATSIFSFNGNLMYTRKKINGVWESWESLNTSGLYRLSEAINTSAVGAEINLSDSVVNYDYLLIGTGAVSGDNYLTHQIVPFVSNFPLNSRGRGKWGAWEGMVPVCHTISGKVVFTFESETKMKIKSFSGNESVRGIFGVKLY